MKKNYLVILLFVFIYGCINKPNENVLKIGIIYPLTGDASFWGENASAGSRLAINNFTGRNYLKNYSIRPYVLDSKSQSKEAVNCLNKAIFQDNIKFIIGDLVSSNLVAMMPILNNNKIVAIGQGSTPLLKKENDFIFRTFPSDDIQGNVISDFIKNFYANEKVSLFYINNDYGLGISNVILEKLPNNIDLLLTYDNKSRDFKNLLIKFLNKKIIVIIGYPEEIPIILKQLNELKYSGTIVGTETFQNDKVIQGNYSFTTYYSNPLGSDTTNNVFLKFRNDFVNQYSRQPNMPADMAYDGTLLMLEAIDSIGFNTENVKKVLSNTANFNGASGNITFDLFGDVIKPFTINEIVQGKTIIKWKWGK